MSRPIYRKRDDYVQDVRMCSILAHNGEAPNLPPRRRAILHTLQTRVTPRQRQCLYLYYARGINMQGIASVLGVAPSTVVRTIQRGDAAIEETLELLDYIKNAPLSALCAPRGAFLLSQKRPSRWVTPLAME